MIQINIAGNTGTEETDIVTKNATNEGIIMKFTSFNSRAEPLKLPSCMSYHFQNSFTGITADTHSKMPSKLNTSTSVRKHPGCDKDTTLQFN